MSAHLCLLYQPSKHPPAITMSANFAHGPFPEASADLHVTATVPLSKCTLDVLTNAFPQKAGFAAFAAHQDGHFVLISGRHSTLDVHREALERCNTGGSGCEIQSILSPDKYDQNLWATPYRKVPCPITSLAIFPCTD